MNDFPEFVYLHQDLGNGVSLTITPQEEDRPYKLERTFVPFALYKEIIEGYTPQYLIVRLLEDGKVRFAKTTFWHFSPLLISCPLATKIIKKWKNAKPHLKDKWLY